MKLRSILFHAAVSAPTRSTLRESESGARGEELFELAIVNVFSHSSSEFFEPLFTASSTGDPGITSLQLLYVGCFHLHESTSHVRGTGHHSRTRPAATESCLLPLQGRLAGAAFSLITFFWPRKRK